MTEITPRHRRIALVGAQEADAARLLSAANHGTMKLQIRLATRDLDEARAWLNQEDVDRRPFVLTIVDMAIGLAAARLTMVQHALQTFGPDAMLPG
jgi:hypothetical protein